jgi:hypothetical protein
LVPVVTSQERADEEEDDYTLGIIITRALTSITTTTIGIFV